LNEQAGNGPLAGIRVLELGRLFAAPMCGQILGDLGADVVKVERKGRGDEFRAYGPGFLSDADGVKSRESGAFLSVNRNKRGIAVDFEDPQDLATIHALAARADVFIENFKVGSLEKHGLDESAVRAANPDVIYLSVTGFGQTGPYAKRPGTDGCFQAMSGLQSLTGQPDGPPEKVGMVIVDFLTGLYGAISVLAALRRREVQGQDGEHIDLALLDCAVSALSYRAIEYRLTGKTPQRFGNGQPGAAPSQVYRCADGQLFLQAAVDEHFIRFCKALGLPDLSQDPRFDGRPGRVRNLADLNAIIEPILAAMPVAVAYAKLVAAGVICAPVNSIPDAFADPQVRHRDMLLDMPHALGVAAPLLGSPIRFGKQPIKHRYAPPMMDQHRAEIVKDWLNVDFAGVGD
jgi:crotonobetainyl-CoA:carnitine CoA-transferase CaiB-like acyl-CoA transferase